MKLAFLDLETTGFSAEKDEIIEVAVIIYEDGKETERYESLVSIDGEIPPIVSQITNIFPKDLQQGGKDWQSVKPIVEKMIEGSIMIGHNIDFDIGFLRQNGIDFSFSDRIDTHELSRILLLNETSYSLEVLSEKYEISHENAHRAMADVEANILLWDELLKEAENLPKVILESFKSFYKGKDWRASVIFDKIEGRDTEPKNEREARRNRSEHNEDNETEKENWDFPSLDPAMPTLIPFGLNRPSANYVKSWASTLKEQNVASLIITPKLSYFNGVKPFPTPEVLFSHDRFMAWWADRQKPSPKEISFALQAVHRHALGLRGKILFDLFSGQYEAWNSCAMKHEDEEYKAVAKEKLKEKSLSITPLAFWRNVDLFTDRTLLIDEGETFIREQIFAPTDSVSLLPLLENETTATASAFAVAGICREIITPSLKSPMGKYPIKIRLDKHQKKATLSWTADLPTGNPMVQEMQDILEDENENTLTFMQYNPNSGNLLLSRWNREKVRAQVKKINTQPRVYFHRHTPADSFFSFWTGKKQFAHHNVPELIPNRKVSLSPPDVGNRSPYYAEKVANKLVQALKDHKKVGVMCSSVDHIFKLGDALNKADLGETVMLGERLSGSNGKLMQKLKTPPERLLFLTQKLLRPQAENLTFDQVFVYTFPFLGPHPLLDSLEEEAKQAGISFWDKWTIPQAAANLNRRLSIYQNADVVIVDPRADARWGATLVSLAFGTSNHS